MAGAFLDPEAVVLCHLSPTHDNVASRSLSRSSSTSSSRTHVDIPECYDDTQGLTAADRGLDALGDRRFHRPHLSPYLHSDHLRHSFSPSAHELLKETDKYSETTDRVYNYHVQKWRLWRLCIFEWFITLTLCALIFGCLWHFHISQGLRPKEMYAFNVIVTGLSIALGLNLTASLQSYARMMRWRLLMARYRPLDQFDLIMGCDRLSNTTRLLFKTWGSRIRFLPSLTGLVCILWVLINVGMTVIVAALGLTYSLVPSTSKVNLQYGGLTSVVELNSIGNTNSNGQEMSHQAQRIAAQQYGTTGQFYRTAPGLAYSDAVGTGTINQDPINHGHYRYWFIDENPMSPDVAATSAISHRYIDSWAKCVEFPVLEGADGTSSTIVYSDGGRKVTQAIGNQQKEEPGAMTCISHLAETCGPRCTQVKVFQPVFAGADGLGAVKNAHFFVCNNSIPAVQQMVGSTTYNVLENVQMPDTVARIVAGTIGWSGQQTPDGAEEFQTYSRFSPETWTSDSLLAQIENEVGFLSMSAVAALDDHGPRKNIIGAAPYVANVLELGGNWRDPGSLLAVIPTVHFLAMIAVLIWAGKAAILDDSALSAAKFLKPMMDRLHTKGNLMRGEDIVAKLNNPRVKYGWRYIDGDVLHAGIFEESTGMVVGPEFRSGFYD